MNIPSTFIAASVGDNQTVKKPACRTCPLFDLALRCHLSTLIPNRIKKLDGAYMVWSEQEPTWYCEQHPGFSAWATQEYHKRQDKQVKS